MKDSLPDLLHWDIYIDAFRHAVLQFYALVWVFFVISDAELIQILYVHIQVHFECYILIKGPTCNLISKASKSTLDKITRLLNIAFGSCRLLPIFTFFLMRILYIR